MIRFIGKVFLNSIIIITLLVSCDSHDNLQESSVFNDESVNNLFIQRLTEKSIPFTIDEDGNIWYPYSRRNEVKSIIDSLLDQEYPATSVFFTELKYAEIFESKLIERDLDYRKDERSGDIYFIWDEKDEVEIRKLVNEIKELYKINIINEYIQERELEESNSK